nr:urease accessory protein UreH [Bacillus sp. REN3]
MGFVLGIKHALEPDHVIAVSTIAGRHKSFWRSGFLGVFWGIGHTATLLAVFAILSLTKLTIPVRWEMSFELAVGIMLIYLGFSAFKKPTKKAKSNKKLENKQFFMKSLFIGQIHGLAGSAAMTLLTLSMVDSFLEACLYIGTFGVGTILGMFLFTIVVSVPFFFSGKINRAERILTGAASVISICYGIYYIYLITIKDGLFVSLSVIAKLG